MNILRRLFFNISPPPVELDITPTVRPVPEKRPAKVATTLEEAARRHGKPFKAQGRVQRETPPSRTLQELNQKSAEATRTQIVVTDIRSRRTQ